MAQASRFRFTKTTIEKLPAPDSGRDNHYDTDVPKLALRITAAGGKTFYVIKREGSGMFWLKLGTFPDMSVENARRAAEAELGKFSTGNNPVKARAAARTPCEGVATTTSFACSNAGAKRSMTRRLSGSDTSGR